MGPSTCILNRLPGDADAASPGTPCEDHTLKSGTEIKGLLEVVFCLFFMRMTGCLCWVFLVAQMVKNLKIRQET